MKNLPLKLLAFGIAAALLPAMAGCSSSGSDDGDDDSSAVESAVLVYTEDDSEKTMTISARDDSVYEVSVYTETDMTSYGYSDDALSDLLESSAESMTETIGAIEGCTFSWSVSDGIVTERMYLDCSTEDQVAAIVASGLLGDMEDDVSAISMSRSVENLVESGWVQQ